MVDLKLEQNEGILLQTTDVGRYDGNNELEVYELYLTNKHLISVYERSNGIFSKSETIVDRIPLSSISVVNGIVQVDVVDDDDYGKTMQIIYTSGKRELFELNVSPKKEYPKWEAAISEAVLKCSSTPFEAKQTQSTSPNNIANDAQNSSNNGQKLFCQYCGTKLDLGARFCKGCGKPIDQSGSSAAGCVPPQTEETFSHKQHTERKTVYEGQLHKCPNCGELLDAFRSHCPSCGYEIRDARSSSSVRELAQKLERIEAERMAPIEEKKSLMKMVFGKDFKEENEVEEAQERFDEHKRQQKANLIINFSVPNTREDILEFMILASSNIDVKKGIDDEVTKAWLSKLDQVYEKAKLLMGNKPSFAQIKNIYDRKKAQIRNRKFKGLAIACFVVGGYICLFSLLFFMEETSATAIILLVVGIAVLVGGIKCISTYNKNDKLNS